MKNLSHRAKSLLAGVAAASALVAGSVLGGVAPAQAAEPVPSFQIYYGLNCNTSYRTYVGSYSGTRQERWINDTFNKLSDRAGYGQKIYYNAASVRLQPRTRLGIREYGYYAKFAYAQNTSYTKSRCINLTWDGPYNKQLRNHNSEFRLGMIVNG